MTPWAVVAQTRFREFGAHMRETRHQGAMIWRDDTIRVTKLYCRECEEYWLFTDAALRETPHILVYFRECGHHGLVESILRAGPDPGAWRDVYFGFLEDDAV